MSSRLTKGKKPPRGFSYVEPILTVLENELRDRVKESNASKRNTESMWPVHQINWQRSRYIYDLYYTHSRISRKVYDYCVKQKLVDANLIAKWKKPGYERLCSTYVINPANYKFGTTSICRVPHKDRSPEQMTAQDPTTGCLGCASGDMQGPRNIFGNKYGQNLAAVQIARERRQEQLEQAREDKAKREREEREREDLEERRWREEERLKREARAQRVVAQARAAVGGAGGGGAGDSETDEGGDSDTDEEDDEEDYGPSPAAGIWAGSHKLEAESEKLADGGGGGGGEEEEDEEDEEEDEEEGYGPSPAAAAGGGDEEEDGRPSKKARAS